MDISNPQQAEPQHSQDHKRHRVLRALARHTINLIGACLSLLLAAGIVATGYIVEVIAPQSPGVDNLLNARGAQPSVLLSAGGTKLATYSRGRQEWVPLDRVSAHVINALIATEDRRFYDHYGIDPGRILAAALRTARGDAQGGSTITQQLVRNMFPEEIGRARTIDRKLREIVTALKIENTYTKDEILETYLNSVPFLYNVVGIEMAARTYYDKTAYSLDASESATLIGMLKGTRYYNPVLNPERALRRRNIVLGQMVKNGMLPAEEFDALREQPLNVTLNRRQTAPPGSAPHFSEYVRKQLLEWAQANDYNIYTDGLVVHSTLDDDLQEAAANAVARQSQALQDIADVEWGQTRKRVNSQSPDAYTALRKQVEPFRQFWQERPELLDTFIRESPEFRKAQKSGLDEAAALVKLKADSRFMGRLRDSKTRLEAGFLAVDPASAEVKAWIGSRDFGRDQFDHVVQAERQPGSTFKPIVYGAAIEQGLSPERVYPDGQVEIRSSDGGIWRPTDLSGFSGRMMSMREGLIYSKNTITAQVMQDVGLPSVISLARAVGVKQSRLDPVPSLSLGTSPVTLMEMVNSYATIARIGEYRKPVAIRKITNREGKVLAEFHGEAQRAMSEDTAIELIDILRGVVKWGTGAGIRNRFNIAADIAGKTGTTQYNTDGWFILMHPNLVAGAWVGFNDSRVTMRSDYWGQGGHNAILLVGDFFRDTLKAKRIDIKAKFPPPKPPPALIVTAPEDEGSSWIRENVELRPDDYGVITQRDSEAAAVLTPGGGQSTLRRDALSIDELARYLADRAREAAMRSGTSSGGGNPNGDASNFPAQ